MDAGEIGNCAAISSDTKTICGVVGEIIEDTVRNSGRSINIVNAGGTGYLTFAKATSDCAGCRTED